MIHLNRTLLVLCAGLLGGCTTINAYKNAPLDEKETPSPNASRATLNIDSSRGNADVLVLLALSGGGSRAAYFSSSVMLALQNFPERDLLAEVDAISSVSGGSIAAAYYAISQDPNDTSEAVRSGRVWNEATVKDLMTRNYALRSFGNWFWPNNIGKYWFTAWDRSDITAQTYADNLFDVKRFSLDAGRDLHFADLNPTRPYLIINATNATGASTLDDEPDERGQFGSIFTFTQEDFQRAAASDIEAYAVARAVMASAAFPLAFPDVTLKDFRPYDSTHFCHQHAGNRDRCNRYIHLFDGGNADNLGLVTFKRVLLEAALSGRLAKFKRIVVICVDAFTRPAGAPSNKPDARGGFFSYFLDRNAMAAVDALLQVNRNRVLGEFDQRSFGWQSGECRASENTLPSALCARLENRPASSDRALTKDELNLTDKLVFYHIGFEDVDNTGPYSERDRSTGRTRQYASLRDRLDKIPTALSINDADAMAIDEAVRRIMRPDNACLHAISAMVADLTSISIEDADRMCKDTEGKPAIDNRKQRPAPIRQKAND